MSDPTKAVFLSYAREDAEVAKRIAEALRGFGVEVWFDQAELRGGEAWDAKIKKQIRECALFLPLVSGQTQERSEGYFRREWLLAVERTRDMAAGRAFVMPVVVDGTTESDALVPEEFMRYQWTRLADGTPTPEFVAQVKRLLEAPKKPSLKPDLPRPPTLPPGLKQAAKAAAEAGYGDPALQTSHSGLARWIALGAGVIVIAAVGIMFLRRPSTPVALPAAITAAPASPAVAPASSDKSIAVLPFTNMSEDKESGFFADGVHEDVLTNLALIRQLRVVSRTSVMPYRTTTKSMRQIAQELGVTYILEGSVRRSGNKVRVTGQLIHAATDEHVWAQAYDRDLTDIFAIQAELSQQIAGALKTALSPEEKELIARRPTESLAAYDAYLKARAVRQRNDSGLMDCEPLLNDAVRLDPKFALAWAELASVIGQAYLNDIERTPARLAKAKAAIDTAVRLAPDDPDIIERVGDFYYYGYRDYARATEQYQRLAVLRPNDAAVIGSLGFIHRRQGRWAEAVKELRRAVELEPRDLRYGHTFVQLLVGLCRYDEAVERQAQIVRTFPDSMVDLSEQAFIPLLARGSRREADAMIAALTPEQRAQPLTVYFLKLWARGVGDWKEAVRLDAQVRYVESFSEPHWSQDISAAYVLWTSGDQAAARALAASAIREGEAELAQKPSPTAWAALGSAHALLGHKADALRCAQTAKDLVPEEKDAVAGPPLSLNYAQVLAWGGEKDRALAELGRLLRTPFGENIYSARTGAGWLPLWDDPRFQALLNDPKNNAPLL
jgi:TolB-like protein/Tfp pilus assembly protein PilF